MRWNAWVALVIAMLAGNVLWIFLLRGPRILDSDLTLILGQLFLGSCAIAIAGLITTTPPKAVRLSRKESRALIIGGTVLIQTLGLLWLWPALSSDVVRYRLDGLIWLTGNSPYANTPRKIFQIDDPDVVDRTVAGKDTHTLYPPVAQTAFIAARAVEMAAFGPAKLEDVKNGSPVQRWRSILPHVSFWHRAIVLRTAFSLAAIGSVIVLLSLLEQAGRTPWLAVLFAWNPLLLLETAGSGHVDILGILLLLVMLRMMQKQHFTLAALSLCLACGVKPLAILFAPLLIKQIAERRDWKLAQRSIGIVLLTLAVVYWPILFVQHGYRGWFGQLNAYAHYLEANSLLFTWGESVLGKSWIGSVLRSLMLLLTPLAAAGVLMWSIKKRIPIADAGYWLMLTPLLLGPAAFPWSILWPLCFVPMMRQSAGWAALTWTATAGLAYAAWRQPTWDVPTNIVMAEYLPVFLALGMQLSDRLRRPAPMGQAATASG